MPRCKYCHRANIKLGKSGIVRGIQRYSCSKCEHRRKLKFRHKEIARRAVLIAIRNGILKRPTQCEFGCIGLAIQAHHDDYSKPLKVRWLCTKHHAQAHPHKKGWNGKRGFIKTMIRTAKHASRLGKLSAAARYKDMSPDEISQMMKRIRAGLPLNPT